MSRERAQTSGIKEAFHIASDPLSLLEPAVHKGTTGIVENTLFNLKRGEEKGPRSGKQQAEAAKKQVVITREKVITITQEIQQKEEQTIRLQRVTELQQELAVVQDELAKREQELSRGQTKGLPPSGTRGGLGDNLRGMTPEAYAPTVVIDTVIATGKTAKEALTAITTNMKERAKRAAEADDPQQLADERDEAVKQIADNVQRAFGTSRGLFLNTPGIGALLKGALTITGTTAKLGAGVEALQLAAPPAVAAVLEGAKFLVGGAAGFLTVTNIPLFLALTLGTTGISIGVIALRNRKYAQELMSQMDTFQAKASEAKAKAQENLQVVEKLQLQAKAYYQRLIGAIQDQRFAYALEDALGLDPLDPETIPQLENLIAQKRETLVLLRRKVMGESFAFDQQGTQRVVVENEIASRERLVEKVKVADNGVAFIDRYGQQSKVVAVQITDSPDGEIYTQVPFVDNHGRLELPLTAESATKIGFFVQRSQGPVSAIMRLGAYPGEGLVVRDVPGETKREVATSLAGIREAEQREQRAAEAIGLFKTLGFDSEKTRGMFTQRTTHDPRQQVWNDSPLLFGADDAEASFTYEGDIDTNRLQVLLYSYDMVADEDDDIPVVRSPLGGTRRGISFGLPEERILPSGSRGYAVLLDGAFDIHIVEQ